MSSFEEAIKIDKFNLDVEWELQPSKYIEWAEKCAKAILERDQCKQRMDVLKARLDKQLRKSLEKELGKKPTEGAISAAIDLEPEMQEMQEHFNQLTYNVNVLTAAKTAFDQRKKALEYLTQLYLSSYYSKPAISGESKFKMGEKKREETNTRLSGAMNRRRQMPKDE